MKAADSRIDGTNYVTSHAPGVCAAPDTGHGVQRERHLANANYGSTGTGVLVYVMRGTVAPWTDTGCCDFTIQSRDLYGTVVVEGNGSAGVRRRAGTSWHKNGSRIWTAAERLRISSGLPPLRSG